jgi:hypothetical protein
MYLRISILAILFVALIVTASRHNDALLLKQLSIKNQVAHQSFNKAKAENISVSDNTHRLTAIAAAPSNHPITTPEFAETENIAAEPHAIADNGNATAYLMMIDALKNEIGIKEVELSKLQHMVTTYQSENDQLKSNLNEKAEALKKLQLLIGEKQIELNLEKQVLELTARLKSSEAESYYLKAQRAEAAANRIVLSPVRKKEHLKEALEVYKKSFSLGKAEAAQNVIHLEKVLFPN